MSHIAAPKPSSSKAGTLAHNAGATVPADVRLGRLSPRSRFSRNAGVDAGLSDAELRSEEPTGELVLSTKGARVETTGRTVRFWSGAVTGGEDSRRELGMAEKGRDFGKKVK